MARGLTPRRRVLLLVGLALLALLALLLWHGEPDELALEPGRARSVDGPDHDLRGGPTLQAPESAVVRPSAAPAEASPGRGAADPGASAPPSAATPGRPPGPLHLRVDVVHALTGADVGADWNLYPLPLDASGRPASIAQELERATAQKRRDGEQPMVRWRREFLPSGAKRKVERKDPWSAPPVVLEDVAGSLVPWEAPASLRAEVAADAQVLVAVVPVGPMAPLEVMLLEEGRPLTGSDRRKRQVRIDYLTLGEEDWPFIEVVEHSAGLVRVQGLPHRPGEPVSAHVSWLPRGATPPATPPAPPERRPAPNLRTAMPELLADGGHPWRVEVPTPEVLPPRDDREAEAELPAPEPARGDPDAPCELRLRVFGHDGRRIAPQDLAGQTLDPEGRIVQKEVPSGTYDLRVTLPGRLPMEKRVELKAGEVNEVVLHEPHGAELEVFVVDELGQVRPTAVLALPGRRWFDTDGPTQRIDLFTDHLGRRRIARVEPGPMIVHARWGSRRGSVLVNLEEDHLTRVTIVAR